MQSVDTIAAIATPPGSGAIAVIRMSGPQATAVMQACTGKVTEPRRATLAYVRDAQGRVLDEVVATYFAGPASYTGEDVVELSCHGGMLVTRRVLERLLQCGARPAEPGEFTRRAFENGRMDLTRAEAVMDIINAGSDLALRAAQNQLHGAIFSKVESAVDKLISAVANKNTVVFYVDSLNSVLFKSGISEISYGCKCVGQSAVKVKNTGVKHKDLPFKCLYMDYSAVNAYLQGDFLLKF